MTNWHILSVWPLLRRPREDGCALNAPQSSMAGAFLCALQLLLCAWQRWPQAWARERTPGAQPDAPRAVQVARKVLSRAPRRPRLTSMATSTRWPGKQALAARARAQAARR
jgi:hypothetical protein